MIEIFGIRRITKVSLQFKDEQELKQYQKDFADLLGTDVSNIDFDIRERQNGECATCANALCKTEIDCSCKVRLVHKRDLEGKLMYRENKPDMEYEKRELTSTCSKYTKESEREKKS